MSAEKKFLEKKWNKIMSKAHENNQIFVDRRYCGLIFTGALKSGANQGKRSIFITVFSPIPSLKFRIYNCRLQADVAKNENLGCPFKSPFINPKH